MTITIRTGTEADYEALNRLRAQVNDLHVQGRPDIFKPGFGPALQEHLRVYLSSDANAALVAEADGQIAGFALVDYIVRPASPYNLPRSFYHLAEFGVDAAFRRRGIAAALLAHMKQDALDRGFSRIELDMWEFNQNALAFYEAAGFRCYRRYMELPLRDTKVTFHEVWQDEALKFAVIAARKNGQWIFCRRRDRRTWELPGGHREPGEAIADTARRELYEETGAVDFDLTPLCAYAVEREGKPTYGMLFAADVRALEEELHSEIGQISVSAALPAAWTYPDIQPRLLAEVQRRSVTAAPPSPASGTVHLICGKICSGKSTFAKRLCREKRAVILSSDDLTAVLPCDHNDSYPIVHAFLKQKAVEIARCGTDVILDWGFWLRADRAALTAELRQAGIPCRWYYINTPEDALLRHVEKRNAVRTAGTFYVDAGLLQKCLAQFEPPALGEMDEIIQYETEENP